MRERLEEMNETLRKDGFENATMIPFMGMHQVSDDELWLTTTVLDFLWWGFASPSDHRGS